MLDYSNSVEGNVTRNVESSHPVKHHDRKEEGGLGDRNRNQDPVEEEEDLQVKER